MPFHRHYYNNLLKNLPYMERPHCNTHNSFISWGYYDRAIYYIADNVLASNVIKIKRVRCKYCLHTHALLPCFIIPYKHFSLDIILHSIFYDSFIQISFDTISKWKSIFNRFLSFLHTSFIDIKQFLNNLFEFYFLFYKYNNKIFMMSHTGIVNLFFFNFFHFHTPT